MPLMYFLNAASLSSASESAESSEAAVGIGEALGYSGLGIAIVFAVLAVLMAFIALMSKLLNGKSNKTKKAPAPKKVEETVVKPIEVPKPVASATVPDGAMLVTLGGKKHTVTVEEKVPQFTVKINGKAHAVDVEPVEEGAK